MPTATPKIVYIVGAGLSAGLGFPTIRTLLPTIWPRLERTGTAKDLSKIIRFHHPEFNPRRPSTFPNIEQLLSDMEANEQLFESTRAATGNFSAHELLERRRELLWQITDWFHEIKVRVLARKPKWLVRFVKALRDENAEIISFNWDLVLDALLFGTKLESSSYGFGRVSGVRLLKPHGSLNWYDSSSGRFLSKSKKFRLAGAGKEQVWVFKRFRAPHSKRREYMPLIVPPVYAKVFNGAVFTSLWREVVSALSTATEVRFIGFSLADADFHARFTLRCGFHNQEEGEIAPNGRRRPPTGRAGVVVVDISDVAHDRIERCVGWKCEHIKKTAEDWILSW